MERWQRVSGHSRSSVSSPWRQVAAAGDYDDDGDIDLFIVRGDSGPNLLYRNTGNLVFEEVAAGAGLAFTKSPLENYRHSSPAFADLDGDNDLDLVLGGLDGDLDWFVSSIRAVGEDVPSHLSRVGNRLYRNDDGAFADITADAGVTDGGWGWGSCFLDFENDGDTDILQLHMHSDNAATLWMNQAPNTQAVGARIVATIAGEDQLREVTLGSNFASHNPTDQLFGLGSMSQVDTLTVEWPDGERTVMQTLAANQKLVIDHPQRCTTPGRSAPISPT